MLEAQILFADHQGNPIPLKPGNPDGVLSFNLSQAEDRFGLSANALTSLYKAFFAQFGSEDGGATDSIYCESPVEVQSTASLEALWRAKFSELSWEQFLDVHEECRRRQLNPWCDHVVAKLDRNTSSGAAAVRLLVKIQGLRALARRTGECLGRKGPYWRAAGQKWVRQWDDPASFPAMARVGIYRKGDAEPTWGMATWKSHAAYVLDESRQIVLDPYWLKMGPHMLAKCAEADGLRAAFPELADLYTVEEMMQSNNPPAPKPRAAHFGRHLVDDQDNPIDDTMRPATRFAFEQSLQKLGIHEPAARMRIIERFIAEAPDTYDTDPRGFYELVLRAVVKDLRRYRMGEAQPLKVQ